MHKDPRTLLFPETKAGGFSRIDGTVMFYTRVNALLEPKMTVVDFGAGRGAASDDQVPYRRSLRTLRGKVSKLIGVDIDSTVLHNEFVDDAMIIRKDQRLPFGNETIDVIIADNVFEHVEDPNLLTREFFRVLRQNGWVCARTPNRNSYVAIAARMTPNHLQKAVLRRAQPDRQTEDIFQTFYRMNTPRKLRELFPRPDWELIMFGHSAEPAYAGNSLAAWRFFVFVHWLFAGSVATSFQIFVRKAGLIGKVARVPCPFRAVCFNRLGRIPGAREVDDRVAEN